MNERLYHVVAINENSDEKTVLTSWPENHETATRILNKFLPTAKIVRLQLEECTMPLDAASPVERASKFNAIYAAVHPDYKVLINNEKVVMSWAKYGGGLVGMHTISDLELRERYALIKGVRSSS